MSRITRLLMLTCALPLLLPPGWCCTLRAAPAGKPAKVKSCCACQQCQRRQALADPSPAKPEPRSCPCSDRAATAPEIQKLMPVTPGFALAPLVPVLTLTSTILLDRTDHSTTAPPLALHILKCCWRC